ncbi:hypothetical protein [Paludisphaera mucosa]|uniref:PEP-CTERM protein-sorting domain-containing protein n=1 Tax=Paludisphaera mucosa TaxID=3030827 RepID=A0ABT6F957_9BACT|nr:hypothetical protein [Paludisphaera mucosa]MDG3003964.1 hypothetical protein [Paludisphaera mucosa]
MVYRRLGLWGLALGAFIGSGPAVCLAVPVNLTGFVEKDFPSGGGTAESGKVFTQEVTSSPTTIGQSSWITQNGWVSGWNVKDIRFSYGEDSAGNNSLAVGFNTWANSSGTYAPFGQANGDPSGTPTAYDPAHLGAGTPTSDKSFALVIAKENPTDPTKPGEVVAIAGVPADKSLNGLGTNGYTVSQVDLNRSSGGLAYMFGTPMNKYLGNLAYDPSPSHPQLEFTVANFKDLVGLAPGKGFWVTAYAGSGLDGVAGETYMGWTYVSGLAPQIGVPEPTTVLAWTLVVGGFAWKARGRKAKGVA